MVKVAGRAAAMAVLFIGCGGNDFSGSADAGVDSSISSGAGGSQGSSVGTTGSSGATGASTVGTGGSSSSSAGGSAGASGSAATGVGGQGGAAGGGGSAGGSGSGGTAGRGGAGGAAGKGGAAGGGGISGGAGSGGMSGAGGGTGDGGTCVPACQAGLICCGSKCVNPNNDILNCGGCGNHCAGTAPFCNGMCATPPCLGGACPATEQCCGDQCCGVGKLCCEVPGPGPSRGPTCTDPMNGTCPPGCPACRCVSPDTPITTPDGSRPIASLRPGDYVYSVAAGRVTVVPIHEIRRVPAKNHVVTRLVLESGAVLEMSGVHPTADGRTIGDLHVGDRLDGVRVVEATVIPYAHDATYDILPDSDTGTYFAAGVLVGSTLMTDMVEAEGATSAVCLPR